MTEAKPRPNEVLRSEELAWEDYTGDSARFGDRTIPLGALGGARQMGFNLVELPPGKQSCPFHYHMLEEEHFFVISGRCVLRRGEERFVMGPGDYVCFPAGAELGHATLNPFEEPCRMIVAGSPPAAPGEVVVFPDSGKARIRSLKSMIPWPQDSLGYDHGEDGETAVGPDEAP